MSVPEGAVPPRITLIACNADTMIEEEIETVEEIRPHLKKWDVLWINVDGLGSPKTFEDLGSLLSLHPLALEDITNLNHRPKMDDYGDYLFVVAKMFSIAGGRLDSEQLSLFMGKKFVLTVQERVGDCFDPVRERLRRGKGPRMRLLHADYLAYAILDSVIDGYFPVLEHFGDRLNALEDRILENPEQKEMAVSHDIRRNIQILRHDVWPMREMINGLVNNHDLVRDDTRPFVRDCYDHIIQTLDILEIYRERCAGMMDIYLSSMSHKMNEIMKVLTIISTIFIPLSFIAGVYGMNFDHSASRLNMPELHWAYGYPFALALMLAVALVLLSYFWRKGWLGFKKTPGNGDGAPS